MGSKRKQDQENNIDSKKSKVDELYSYSENSRIRKVSQSEIEAYLKENNVQVQDPEESNFRPIMKFKHISFPKKIKKVFKTMLKFEKPSPIQAVSWPCTLSGRDFVGIAKTGSGKTYAFGMPALVHIMNSRISGCPKKSNNTVSPFVVILSPTRELAIQIKDTLDVFTNTIGISSVVVYGGAPKHEQKKQLFANGGADMVIATPGRFMDLLGFQFGGDAINKKDAVISLDRVGQFVLDEADRMLDMGKLSR